MVPAEDETKKEEEEEEVVDGGWMGSGWEWRRSEGEPRQSLAKVDESL
jgi:hypothetical protein